MLIIGLTGSLATGKTTVAGMFRRRGGKVIDADKLTHELMRPKTVCFRSIVRRFGKDVCSGGKIDRRRLAAIVFNDARRLKELCRIIHPAVVKSVKKTIALHKENKKLIFIIDAPLLIEAGLHRLCDVIIVVKANRQLQIKRILRRMKIKRGEAVKRINSQMGITQKVRWADIVIDNRKSLSETKKQVEAIWRKLTKEK